MDFDRGLNAAVTRLRQALSDSAETPRYVETVARRGYRFVPQQWTAANQRRRGRCQTRPQMPAARLALPAFAALVRHRRRMVAAAGGQPPAARPPTMWCR